MPLAFLVSMTGFLRSETPAPAVTPDSVPLCHGPANDMALLAADESFQRLHAEPVPFTYHSAAGEMIQFTTPDGKSANGFLLKAKNGKSDKWLLVYQEWWGLNDHIKQQAETFYNDLKDVNVLAVDMYDGKVATTREEAGKLMQGAPQERLASIMKGALTYAGPNAKVASVGWCFGGMLSLQSAILAGNKAVGCVMYYGRPEQNVEKLKTLQTDVLGIFGSRDKGIPPAAAEEFEKNMKAAGEKVTIKMYDAEHAFANPSNPAFDKEAAADAYKLALNYLKDRLKA